MIQKDQTDAQIKQAELQLKQADLQRKSAKDLTDAQLKEASLEIDAARILSQQKQTAAKIMADAAAEDEKLKVKQIIEGTRLGASLELPMDVAGETEEDMEG